MKRLRTLTLVTAITIVVAAFALISAAARTRNTDDFVAADTYKAKCVACHGAAAEKKFDATLSDADLVQIEAVPSFPNQFSTYRNKDFATLKGVDLGFALRRVNHIQANIAYTLSWALGTGSVSNTQRNIAWTASDPPKQTAPLDFDQRHKISFNLDYLLGKAEGPKMGGVNWLENTSINVLYNIASGTPYTPTNIYDEVTLAAVASQPEGALNSRYGPWTNSLDFKVSRGFNTRGLNMSVYALVQNLFDTNNAINVFTGTGSPNTTSFLNTADGRAAAQNLANEGIDPNAAYNMALQNENLYSIPRTIRFGMRVGF